MKLGACLTRSMKNETIKRVLNELNQSRDKKLFKHAMQMLNYFVEMHIVSPNVDIMYSILRISFVLSSTQLIW